MELPKMSNYLFAIVFAAILVSSSMAGGQRKLMNKDPVKEESMETSDQSMQTDDEVVVNHGRILKVKTNDYGSYDPSPSVSKPHFKDIPN